MNLSFMQLSLSLKGSFSWKDGHCREYEGFRFMSIWEYPLLLDMLCGATLSSGYALPFSSCAGFNCVFRNQSF